MKFSPLSLLNLPTLQEIRAEQRRRDLLRFGTDSIRDYKPGWVHRDICNRLMQFSKDVAAMRSPRLAIFVPPRHGKSFLSSERFPAWHLGHYPHHKFIVASYSSMLSESFSLRCLNLVQSQYYQRVFPNVSIVKSNVGDWQTVGLDDDGNPITGVEPGGYLAAGITSSVTGHGANIFGVDDPFKDAQEAASEHMREKAWLWYTNVAYVRLAPGGGILVLHTRWHQDDLGGRLIAAMADGSGDKWDIVNYPAIAEVDEPFRKAGEALHPDRYPLERLQAIKKVMGERDFEALYQQNPTPREGDMMKVGKIKPVHLPPAERMRTVRYWDKAASDKKTADRTAGVKMSILKNGQFLIEHAVFGRWSVGERENVIRSTAELDGTSVKIYHEREGGGSGKESAEATTRNLAGFIVEEDPPMGNKTARAEPFAKQIEAGNVFMLVGSWNQEYIDELRFFPNGKHDDLVDGSSGAFNKLAVRGYNLEALSKWK